MESIVFTVLVVCGVAYSQIPDTCAAFKLKHQYFDKRLIGHSVMETKVTNHHGCARECMSLAVCKSTDYTKRENTCKLNDVESYSFNMSEFVTQKGAIFSDISDWPNTMNGRCSSRPCSINQRCIDKKETYFCMDLTCDSHPAIDNGKLLLNSPGENKFLDTATVACDTEHDPSQTEVMCQASGEWEHASCVKPTDCKQVLKNRPDSASGLYNITLWQSGHTLEVYCDMDTDGGGWTVFQRRFNGSVDFYRSFVEYEHGFGNVHGEFWLGLKYVQELAEQGPTELRTDMSKADGATAYETFQDFGLSAPNYVLNIGSWQGTTGDASSGLKYNNGQSFTTYDNGIGVYSVSCAVSLHGGWWYDACTYSNLNGNYCTPGTVCADTKRGMSGLTHYGFSGYVSMRTSKMMLRRL